MNKLLLLFSLVFSLTLFTACGSDDEPQKTEVELIYNEPILTMFGKTIEDIKNLEERELVQEINSTLEYKDSKNGLSYNIIYFFRNSVLDEIRCQFSGEIEDPTDKLRKSLDSKYTKKSNNVTYLSDDEIFVIWIMTEIPSIYVVYKKRG